VSLNPRRIAAALLASSAISTPALADNPRFRNWDENGVDLVRGDYRFSFVEGSIGSGKAELALIRVNNSDAFSQWDQFLLSEAIIGGAPIARVTNRLSGKCIRQNKQTL
jgi:hypothetical protein